MSKHLASPLEQPKRRNKTSRPAFGGVKLPRLTALLRRRKRFKLRPGSYERQFSRSVILPVLAAALLFVVAWIAPLANWLKTTVYALSVCASAAAIVLRTVRRLQRRVLPKEDLLVMLGTVLLFCLRHPAAAALALLLSRLSELTEAYVLSGGDSVLENLRELMPEKARMETEDGPQNTVPEALAPGDQVRVYPKEVFPLDGQILQGSTEADFSPLTGGEDLRKLVRGDAVFAGCVNREGEVIVTVTRGFEDSALVRLIKTAEQAASRKAELEKLIGRISRIYVPALAAAALLLGLVPPLFTHEWSKWLTRAAVLLLLSSPSAVLLSVPLALHGAVMGCAGRGVLVKGQDCVETMARTKTAVFGKTGIITEGKCSISDIFPDGVEARELLAVAAAAESYSVHPIAIALKKAAGWTPAVAGSVMQVEEQPGKGVSVFLQGRQVYVGNAQFLEDHGIACRVPNRAGAAVHVAVGNLYWGHIMISDKPREGAFDALEALRMEGVSNTVMLTGDVLSVSRPLAASLNFDMVKTELSPEGKLSAIDYLLDAQGAGERLAFVGDGIHDAELLARADLGLTIDALKSAEAQDAADIAILGGDIETIPVVKALCTTAYRIAMLNAASVGGVKLVLLILAVCGVMPAVLAAGIQLAVTGFVMFQALRAFSAV